jgi:hypothetical protein
MRGNARQMTDGCLFSPASVLSGVGGNARPYRGRAVTLERVLTPDRQRRHPLQRGAPFSRVRAKTCR